MEQTTNTDEDLQVKENEGLMEDIIRVDPDLETKEKENPNSSFSEGRFSRKAHLSKKSKPKKGQNLRVHFNEVVKINEFEQESQESVTEEELKRNEDIIKNMFQDEENQTGESSLSEKLRSSWMIASSMIAASKRLASLAKNSLTSDKETTNSDSVTVNSKNESELEENDEFSLASETLNDVDNFPSAFADSENSRLRTDENVKAFRRKHRKMSTPSLCRPVDTFGKTIPSRPRRQSLVSDLQGAANQRQNDIFVPGNQNHVSMKKYSQKHNYYLNFLSLQDLAKCLVYDLPSRSENKLVSS